MIKRFSVTQLSGQWDYDFPMHRDVNVFTGRNGAGKTTVLKLLWFMISGNIERIVPEVRFDTATVETDTFTLKLNLVDRTPYPLLDIDLQIVGKEPMKRQIPCRQSPVDKEKFHEVDKEIAAASEGSVFFPTFRRIEGGFSILVRSTMGMARSARLGSLQESMLELSNELSYGGNSFVSSISTDDIESLLTQQYAETSGSVSV